MVKPKKKTKIKIEFEKELLKSDQKIVVNSFKNQEQTMVTHTLDAENQQQQQ